VFPVEQIVFYSFAAILIVSSMMVVTLRNTVHACLSLILAFFSCACLWMLLQAEFLALVLVFVYVGAVMTLFLFVVMMLNVNLVVLREGFAKWLPYGLVAAGVLVGLLAIAFNAAHLSTAHTVLPVVAPHFSSTQALGELMYTQYVYPLEIAAVILLVAMISAVALAFHGRRAGTKGQRVPEQLKVQAKDRVRLVKMKGRS